MLKAIKFVLKGFFCSSLPLPMARCQAGARVAWSGHGFLGVVGNRLKKVMTGKVLSVVEKMVSMQGSMGSSQTKVGIKADS